MSRRPQCLDPSEHGDVRALVLRQDGAAEGSGVAPVKFDELLGNPVDLHVERRARIIATLDRYLDERDQQCELVGRDELTFVEDLLDPRQKDYLIGVRRDPRHGLFQYRARSGMIHRTPPRGSAMSPR